MKTKLLLLLLFPIGLYSQNIVLPGDANNDGRVDHLDLLAIGLNIGKSGPPRSDQGIDWTPKSFAPWAGILPQTGVNAGFADCDGDGLVTNEDVLALEANYDSTHNASAPPPQPYLPAEPAPTTAVPKLVFTFDRDTVGVSDTLRLTVFYEQPPGLPEPESPMGVAFRLEFEESFIQDSLTRVFFEPGASDLMFAAGATGFADSRAVVPGKVEFSATGRHAPSLSFPRPLGVFEFIIEDVIVRSDTFWTDFKIDVADVLFLDTLERVFEYEVAIDEVVLFQPLDSFAVCPGDANNDGRVNNLDVLAIGLAYKQTGIPRAPQYQGMGWAAKPYEPWTAGLPATGINLAFCDSDGNGQIDDTDMEAIQLHYDSTHSLAVPASAPYTPPPSTLPVFTKPVLEFLLSKDTLQAGDTLLVDVVYTPPESSQLEAIPSGLAFTLGFDESLVQDDQTSVMFPVTDDLLVAAGASNFAFSRTVPPGRVEIGVAGKTKPPEFPALGQPQILCTVQFILETLLPPGHPDKFQLKVSDLLMLNQQEQSMDAETKVADATILTGTRQPGLPIPVTVFPSPVRHLLHIRADGPPLNSIRIWDANGLEVARWNGTANTWSVDTRNWLPGVYLVGITGPNGRTGWQKILKL